MDQRKVGDPRAVLQTRNHSWTTVMKIEEMIQQMITVCCELGSDHDALPSFSFREMK